MILEISVTFAYMADIFIGSGFTNWGDSMKATADDIKKSIDNLQNRNRSSAATTAINRFLNPQNASTFSASSFSGSFGTSIPATMGP